MSQHWIPLGTCMAALLVLGGTLSRSDSSLFNPRPAARVAASPPSTDTIQASTTTGTPLIRPLPAQLNDAPVSRYTLVEAPALTGVAGRSFTWIPEGSKPGTYDVRLRAQHPDAAADTLVLRIELAS